MKIDKVAVTVLRDNVYYATMWVKIRGKVHEADARPSDAVTLALRTKVPIFVTPEVLETNKTVLTSQTVLPKLKEIHRKDLEGDPGVPEEVEMEWRSFRSLPRGEMGGWLKPVQK